MIIAPVGAPGAAKDQQLDLIRWMTDLLERSQPRGDLPVGIELVLQPSPGSRLVGEVALGHTHVAGAEDAFSGARIGFGQDGDGCNAREGPDRLQPDARQEVGVFLPFAALGKLTVRRNQHLLAQVTAIRQGVPAQSVGYIPPGAHIFQNLASQG